MIIHLFIHIHIAVAWNRNRPPHKTLNKILNASERQRAMGRSRRKYKRSRTKVRVGLPKKNPHLFKPAFSLPPKLRSLVDELPQWDGKASVIQNYKSFGLVSNPNLLGVRSRTSHIVESESLQVTQPSDEPANEFEPIDSGSDLEEDGQFSPLSQMKFQS